MSTHDKPDATSGGEERKGFRFGTLGVWAAILVVLLVVARVAVSSNTVKAGGDKVARMNPSTAGVIGKNPVAPPVAEKNYPLAQVNQPAWQKAWERTATGGGSTIAVATPSYVDLRRLGEERVFPVLDSPNPENDSWTAWVRVPPGAVHLHWETIPSEAEAPEQDRRSCPEGGYIYRFRGRVPYEGAAILTGMRLTLLSR